MIGAASIFLDINLPNATTWFYFSGLLAVALFFKFSRWFSVRNWDVLTLFLLMPGLLLRIESAGNRWAFFWLLLASAYFFLRCLLDLVLVRRPALSPNLNLAGLVWLAGTLFVSLIAVAVRQPAPPPENGKPAAALDDVVRNSVAQEFRKLTAGDTSAAELWAERGLALGCHLAIVVGLVLIGWLHFEDLTSGMAAATFYLLLPYTFLMMPGAGLGRWDQAWPMAWMVWAVVAYRKPVLTGLLLGLASGSVFLPVLTLPVWLSFYWGRGLGRFLLGYLAAIVLCLFFLGGLVWFIGELPRFLQASWAFSGWKAWGRLPPGTIGFWQEIHPIYRLPVFIASLAFALVTLFWPAPKNLAHVLALSAGILISVEFWYADQGGIHVLWYLPYLLLLVFRPNLSTAQPNPPPDDWLGRAGTAIRRRLAQLLRWLTQLRHKPQTAAPVS